jgi:hypothetical protein
VWDPLDVLCTGLGAWAGAGAVVGGASVGRGGAAVAGAGAAAGWAGAWAGVGLLVLATVRAFLDALADGLGVAVAVADEVGAAGLAGAWLLVVWAGAVRANTIAKVAAARALSWVVRQVRRERRRRPSSLAVPAGVSSRVGKSS